MTQGDVRAFVEEAGSIINMSTEKQEEIIKRLEEEGISERWQMKSVSKEHWESMGAPDGFVVILETCFERHAERALEELKEIISSDVNQVIVSAQTRKNRTGSRRLGSSMSDLQLDDVDDAYNEASPVALALRRRNSLGPGRRSRSSSSGGSLSDLIDDLGDEESNPVAQASPARRKRSTIGGTRRVSKSHDASDKQLDIAGKRRRRRSKSKSVESLNDVDDRRVSKSPERRRAVIGHDVSDKELEIAGERGNSLGSRRRRSKSKSVESLNDVDDRRVSKSPERRRAVIGHDVSDKELEITGKRGNSLGSRRRRSKSKSVEPLNDVNIRVSKSPERRRAVIGHDVSDKELELTEKKESKLIHRQRKSRSVELLNDVNRRVSKSPESRRAVIGHDVSDKELELQGQRSRSLGPRHRKSKSIEPLNDVDNVDDNNGHQSRKSQSVEPLNDVADDNEDSSLGPRRRLSKSVPSLRNIGDLDAGNKDITPVTPRSRRVRSVGHRRLSNSPEKRRALIGADSSYSELDAVERSRMHRKESRRRLKKSASTSNIISLKGEDESSISSSLRRSTRSTSDDDENSISSRRQRTRGTTSNLSASCSQLEVTDNDTTMKTRRRARTKKRSGAGRLHSESKSPSRSFARCQSESPSAMRALLSERDPPAAPAFRRANSYDPSYEHLGSAQFQPSLDHAIQSNKGIPQFHPSFGHAIQSSNSRSDIFSDDCSLQSSKSLEHSTSVTKDAKSGRFCYMSRGRIIYEWDQSFDTMILMVPKPPEVPEEDVICTIEELSLQLGSKGDEQAFFHRPLGGKCDPEKSIWVTYGGADVKGVLVNLKKANPGEKWKRPLLPVTKVKKKKQPDRRSTVPEDFGSPGLRMSRVVGKAESADLATPQHANRPGKTSKHSADFLLDLPNEEHGNGDEESFGGSTCSLPLLGLTSEEEADEIQAKETKKDRRRRRREGRKKMWQAASAMSPFSLKVNLKSASTNTMCTETSDSPSLDELKEKTLDFRSSFAGRINAASARSPFSLKINLKSASTKTMCTDPSDSPSLEELKEKTLDFRNSFAGRINAISKSNVNAVDVVHSTYHQLDDGDDDESDFSTHEEPEPSPKQQPFEPESEPNSFSDMLMAAAPLPFDPDSPLLGSSRKEAPKTETKQLLSPNQESSQPATLPNQAPRSPSRVLSWVDGSRGGQSSPRY
eukprot:CAMPEP_0113620832 /NCGR_PEP_ID=MMETSP0017_2-20120614/10626_1 /TAXON_ID=2856 /ORGANISM="Cylindrotheca closterium" /LENGTH=1189 /DNA_ID=CAMNT_0000530525 /DNA_START=28 /DNA_END=3597 /DNA_ORIENTATION=- /assembly_acc=CAM_ASM_000147